MLLDTNKIDLTQKDLFDKNHMDYIKERGISKLLLDAPRLII